MCGINIIFHNDQQPVSSDVLEQMNHALHHRGPDGQGVKIINHMGLGHTRLSIVDIKGGAQPLVSPDGRYSITFNGEIYNYKALRKQLQTAGFEFKTKTDTEVILHLFRQLGQACLSQLRGMFVFAIVDRATGSLFIARDRLGIKPLCYHWNGQALIAGSEIKSIFASGYVQPEFNLCSVRNFFNYQFSVTPNTVFKDILELPPGHYMEISQGGEPRLTEYWDLQFPEDEAYESLDDDYWVPRFEDALHAAAECHTTGDVPIGAYLSGGIDSSATTYLLKKYYPKKFNTFSIHLTNPNSDESYAYRPVAKSLKLPNNELTVNDDDSNFLETLIDCCYHLEQPQRMAVDIPYYLLAKRAHESKYKVIYTGDGADEILAGYDCFRQSSIRVWGNQLAPEYNKKDYYFSEFSDLFSYDFLHTLLALHEPEKQQAVQQKFGFYPAWYDFWQIMESQLTGVFSDELLQATQHNHQMDELAAQVKSKVTGWHPLNQSLYLEAKTRLPSWILWKGDRINMANSIEARLPFLDHPLVELVNKLPPGLKLNEMDEKYILKSMVFRHLPEIPGQYKKRGFYTPIKEWLFAGEKADRLAPYLSTDALREAGLFDPNKISAMLAKLSQLPTPSNMNEYYRCMQLEWILMLVLTTQILHKLYIKKTAPCFMHAP